MRYIVDHDNHIHSHLSLCSDDPAQTTSAMLEYAKKNNYDHLVVTDHCWDERIDCHDFGFYKVQNIEHIKADLPLPQDEKVKFLFGCETDMDIDGVIGISDDVFEFMDFVIVSTTHLHFKGVEAFYPKDTSIEGRRKLWISRLETLINHPFPENRIGFSHPTWGGIASEYTDGNLLVMDGIPDSTLRYLCQGLRDKKCGVELNFNPDHYKDDRLERMLRFFRIAKEEGCKFYFGSDAHHPDVFEKAPARFNKIVDLLELTEDDKFHIAEH